ncbi:MAG TPA: ribonuclease P protein component [Candidatus Saccharimonadales bacterium]|nr:ribonuclease P protein component [Candidatus Saccharimonadales bacterium]
MLSRANRFHGLGSLRHVYRGGQTARGPLFGVKAVTNSRRRDWRAAVVVSRKVNKSAVARNRIRRRLYEALRQLDAQITRPHDIVVTVFSDKVIETPHAELTGQLKKQLKQAGVLQ